MRLVFLVLLLALPLGAVVFVPPDDTKSLFKRDLLPIDTDTMRELSSQLTVLSRREMRPAPAEWRATAQLLAIATRLDPSNRPARELGRKLAGRDDPNRPDPTALSEALAETWHIVDWLLQPEAGTEGQRLGHQLLDALRIIDPAHPSARRYDQAGEAARWNGIVADPAKFKGAPAPTPADPPPSVPDPTPADPPAPPPPPVDRPPILLRETSLKTPLLVYDKDYKPHLRIVPVVMKITANEDAGPLTFEMSPEFESPILEVARERVRTSMTQTWSALPVGSLATLETGGERYASRNATAITGPAALLLHAALTGKELRQDLVLLGDVKEDGTLTRPRLSWDYLRVIRTGKGGRLVVPPDFQAELRSMLALQDPGFFLKWEVLVVSSLDAALSLGTVGGDPEGLVAASELFAEIRRVGEGKDVGQLSVNKFVRDRLADIQQKAPFHLSASMLLLQGSGTRPTRIEREVLARIIRSGIEPLVSVSRADTDSLSADRLDAVFTASRKSLDPYLKFIEKDDLALHKEALDLTNLVRTMGRSRRLAKTLVRGNGDRHAEVLFTAHETLKSAFPKYLEKLAPYTGEFLPDDAPGGP